MIQSISAPTSRLTRSIAWPVVRPFLYKLLNYRQAVRMADAVQPLSGAGDLPAAVRHGVALVRGSGIPARQVAILTDARQLTPNNLRTIMSQASDGDGFGAFLQSYRAQLLNAKGMPTAANADGKRAAAPASASASAFN